MNLAVVRDQRRSALASTTASGMAVVVPEHIVDVAFAGSGGLMIDLDFLSDVLCVRTVISDHPTCGDQLHVDQSVASVGLAEVQFIEQRLDHAPCTSCPSSAAAASASAFACSSVFDALQQCFELGFLMSELFERDRDLCYFQRSSRPHFAGCAGSLNAVRSSNLPPSSAR